MSANSGEEPTTILMGDRWLHRIRDVSVKEVLHSFRVVLVICIDRQSEIFCRSSFFFNLAGTLSLSSSLNLRSWSIFNAKKLSRLIVPSSLLISLRTEEILRFFSFITFARFGEFLVLDHVFFSNYSSIVYPHSHHSQLFQRRFQFPKLCLKDPSDIEQNLVN